MNNLYEVGDRVFARYYEQWVSGIVVSREDRYGGYVVWIFRKGYHISFSSENLKPDLCNVEKPFGLCGTAVQEGLRKAWNNKPLDSNLLVFLNCEWKKSNPYWLFESTYRLDPNWKKEKEVRRVTMAEVCERFGEDVVIEKEEV